MERSAPCWENVIELLEMILKRRNYIHELTYARSHHSTCIERSNTEAPDSIRLLLISKKFSLYISQLILQRGYGIYVGVASH